MKQKKVEMELTNLGTQYMSHNCRASDTETHLPEVSMTGKDISIRITIISFISLWVIGYSCLKKRGWRMVTSSSNAIMRDKNQVIHMIHDNFTVSNKSFIVEQWFDFVIERYESCMKHFWFIHGPSTVRWTSCLHFSILVLKDSKGIFILPFLIKISFN